MYVRTLQKYRQKDKNTEIQKDRETERQKDRKTERQKDRKPTESHVDEPLPPLPPEKLKIQILLFKFMDPDTLD